MGIINYKKKAKAGVLWTTGQRFLNMFVQFVSGVILARLLTPDDYGCIGMITIFMVVSQAFLDGGFGSALIQKKKPTQDDYSTIFFWNLGMSLVLYAILYLSAPFISNFYHMPLLCSVLRVQGLVLIISAFSIVQINQLNKQFQFRKIAIVSLLSSIIALSTTIYLAFKGYGVWSLVIQSLLMALIPTVIYWFINKWYPTLAFSKESFRELLSFGFFIFLTNLINNICSNIEGLLIGRFYNASTMGFFSKAKSTSNLATMSISESLKQVTYPLYAEYQDDKSALIGILKKATLFATFIVFPMMALLILLATPIFILLFSEKWLDSVPYFQLLCIACMATCLQGINNLAIAAIGKSKTMFNYTIYKRLFGIAVIVIGMLLWGMNGLLIGMILQSWFAYVINGYLVAKHIGYPMKQQITDIIPITILVICSFVTSYVVSHIFGFNMLLDSLLKFTLFVSVFFAGTILFKMEAITYVKMSGQTIFKKLTR